MNDDPTRAVTIAICVCICVVVGSFAGCETSRYYTRKDALVDMVKAGANPIDAACAIDPTASACLLRASK